METNTVSAETLKKQREIKQTIEALHQQAVEIYKQFSDEVQKHAESKYAIPSVTNKLTKLTSPVQSLKLIAEAQFEGQKLTNQYYITFAPKLNEIYYDAFHLTKVLYQAFMNDPIIVPIKTSTEKERRYQSFSLSTIYIYNKIELISENFKYLGKYTESIVFALTRLQNMVDSIDKMRSKEMWAEETSSTKALDILSNSELGIEEFTDTVEPTQEQVTELVDGEWD